MKVIAAGNVHQLRAHLQRYFEQRQAAKQRGIEWALDFWTWLEIWQTSGHLDERGRHRGSYQMCRFEDIGPYASSNVRIDRMENNIREAKALQKVAGATKTFPDCLTANST